MPNVMGREFPYTAEGMAAAQQYSQAMGMRDGGPMGFRPLGYADGDAVNANRQVYSDFKTALTELPANELAGYIYNNLSNLKSMAEANPAFAAQLANAMEKSGFEGYMRNLIQGAGQVPEEQGGNLGRMNTPPQGMSDFPGYEPETGDFYSPHLIPGMPPPGAKSVPMPPPGYRPFGGAEEGDQYLIPGMPPPGAKSVPMTPAVFEEPTNPATGLPWTDEERGPLRRIPKEDGFGYYTGDNSGIYGETLEYVPSRYPTGSLEIEPMANGGLMSLRRR